MKLALKGTMRSRTRINLIFFTIAGPWKTQQFDSHFVLPDADGLSQTFNIAGVPIVAKVKTRLSDRVGVLDLELAVQGVRFFQQSFYVGGSKTFHVEPIKGVILDGSINLTN